MTSKKDSFLKYLKNKKNSGKNRNFLSYQTQNTRRKEFTQKKQKNKKWNEYAKFACDFETTYHKEYSPEEILSENRNTNLDLNIEFSPDSFSKVFLSGIMDIETKEYFLCFENIKDTLNTIAYHSFKKNKRKALCWYHNLAYDGSYILNWLQKHKYKQTLRIDSKTKEAKPFRGEYSLLSGGGKFFSLILWWNGIRITFLDSLKILPTSLEKLGQVVGFEKLKDTVDYKEFKIKKDHNYPQKWLEYLKRDCLILATILESFYSKEWKAKNPKLITIGSIVFNEIKKDIKKLVPNFTINDYKFWTPWYRGGLCFPSFNYWGKWAYSPNRIKSIDITSSYPYSMTQLLPFGKPEKKILPAWKNNFCAFYYIHINKAKIKKQYSDIAFIPKNYKFIDGVKKIRTIFNGETINNPFQYVQEVEDWDYHFIDCEFELIKQIYDIDYTIIDTWYFQTDKYLKDYIELLFKDKQQASIDKNETLQLIYKLKLNNCYGKLGQNPIKTQDFYGKYEDIDQTKFKIVGIKNTKQESYNIQIIKKNTDSAKPVFISAYISALSRVHLMKKYKEITDKGGIFLYCDTDSIFYIDKKKPIKLSMIGENLGEWKPELFNGVPFCDGFIALAPKFYRCVNKNIAIPTKSANAGLDKVALKGITNDRYNYSMAMSDNSIPLKKKSLKNSEYGKEIVDTPFSFKKWANYFPEPVCPEELKPKK